MLGINFGFPGLFEGSISGAVVGDTSYGGVISQDIVIDYEDISLENITQEKALNAVLQAEKDKEEMQEQGFGIVWVNDTLIEAKRYFEGEDYTSLLADIAKIKDLDLREKSRELLLKAQENVGVSVDYQKVLESTKAIDERKKKAFEINDLIRASELRIEEFKQEGLNPLEAEKILSDAVVEFNDERYEQAEELLESIGGELIELSAETTLTKTLYRAGRDNLLVFLKENYQLLLLIFGSLLIALILLYNRLMIFILKRKIQDMKVEAEVLMDLLKKAQTDYFAKGIITKQTFEIKTAKYKQASVSIKQKLPVLESLLDKRLKSKRVL